MYYSQTGYTYCLCLGSQILLEEILLGQRSAVERKGSKCHPHTGFLHCEQKYLAHKVLCTVFGYVLANVEGLNTLFV